MRVKVLRGFLLGTHWRDEGEVFELEDDVRARDLIFIGVLEATSAEATAKSEGVPAKKTSKKKAAVKGEQPDTPEPEITDDPLYE